MGKLAQLGTIFAIAIGIAGTNATDVLAQSDRDLALVDPYLATGRLSEGETALKLRLQTDPDDDSARFGVGTLQFFQAIETLSQSLYRYGLDAQLGRQFGIPFLRLPIPLNPDPETLSYEQLRAIFAQLNADLAKVEATLSEVESESVKMPIRFGAIRLDLDGDGTASEEERFWRIYTQYNRPAESLDADLKAFVIGFDKGDVHWLRGYVHLLRAMTDVILAHDTRELFERTAHLFFARVESPHEQLQSPSEEPMQMGMQADLIAAIHLMRFEPVEADRMRSALGHLEGAIAQSRQSWESILAETDSDREWIPSPNQESVIPVQVSEEMVEAWQVFLDEADALLAGRKLVPHWRIRDGRGVNLRRVFAEPTTLDAVLWVQGSAATPYLETGELTQPEVWWQFQEVFRGNFIGFAIWFN
jgi:hypothetical protein